MQDHCKWYLRWSCSEKQKQKNIKSQHALTISIFFIIILLSTIYYNFCYLQVRIYNTTQCYSSFYDQALCKTQKCLFCIIVENALTMVLHSPHELIYSTSQCGNEFDKCGKTAKLDQHKNKHFLSTGVKF